VELEEEDGLIPPKKGDDRPKNIGLQAREDVDGLSCFEEAERVHLHRRLCRGRPRTSGRPLTVPGDSGWGPVTSTLGWCHLREGTQHISTPKAQGDRTCPACPGTPGFFLQSIYVREGYFKGYKMILLASGGPQGTRLSSSPSVLPVPRYIPGIASARSAGRALTP